MFAFADENHVYLYRGRWFRVEIAQIRFFVQF